MQLGIMEKEKIYKGHTAAATTDLLEKNSIPPNEWLPKVADLNPIEHCFGEL